MARAYSAALPIAYVVLRLLVVANWLIGAAILLLLFALPHQQWILDSFGIGPSPDSDRLVRGLQWVAVLGLVAVPLNHVVLTRLVRIVESVRAGDPFARSSALHLRTIAWVLLGLQLLSMVIGAIGESISSKAHPIHLDAGFSISGWLAVLLTFVLSRVFAVGTVMREDLDGTV